MAAYEFIVCDPNTAAADRAIRTTGPAVADVPCTTSTGVAGHPKAVALDPTLNPPFDPAAAGAFFGFAFASTMFVYLLSLGCGAIIKAVKWW